MMADNCINIQFCGFGGQGIILLAVIFGTTAVTKAGMNAVQTQSYGSEARGGECQAEVIVSNEMIDSPLADQMDILVSMSQSALDKYLPRLRPGGTVIYDPELVERPDRTDITAIEFPATQTAGETGLKLAANMAMLGFLRQVMGLFTEDDMFEIIRETVPHRFKDANIEAAKRGGSLARERRVVLEV